MVILSFRSNLIIPEDIVGEDVEHNPNQHQTNRRGGGNKEGVCMPEQENLEEQAKQDNEKLTQKRKKQHEHKCEQSWSRKEH